MTECKHGLEPTWCSICDGKYVVETSKPKRSRDCCAPHCKRRASNLIGNIPLCGQHVLMVEKAVVRDFRFKYHERSPVRTDWVYFVQIGHLIKVGHSVQVETRIRSFAAYGQHVKVLGLEFGGRALEARLHRKFSKYRRQAMLSREMFEPDPVVLAYIQKGRQCMKCNSKAQLGRVVCLRHDNLSIDEEEIIGQEWNVQLHAESYRNPL